MTIKFGENVTYSEKYGPAMEITDQDEALAYFEACVQRTMSFGKTRAEAIEIEKANIGYWAGYYDLEVRLRVERLFDCQHPIFGPAREGVPTVEEAFETGRKFAESGFES